MIIICNKCSTRCSTNINYCGRCGQELRIPTESALKTYYEYLLTLSDDEIIGLLNKEYKEYCERKIKDHER